MSAHPKDMQLAVCAQPKDMQLAVRAQPNDMQLHEPAVQYGRLDHPQWFHDMELFDAARSAQHHHHIHILTWARVPSKNEWDELPPSDAASLARRHLHIIKWAREPSKNEWDNGTKSRL